MIEIRTPCRLHFGLLAFSRSAARQFGGVGVMIRRPDILIRVKPAAAFTARGYMADRAITFAQRFVERSRAQGWTLDFDAVDIDVARMPRPHTGLGTGTQLGMAVAAALAAMAGRADLTAFELAQLVGRGERSAIGAHGFHHGGLIVEGGKAQPDVLSPMLVRQPFPATWRIVLIRPMALVDRVEVSGEQERSAFESMPDIPTELTAEMCRLVLLGLVPAILENDIQTFSDALYGLQQLVGSCFAGAQGGVYADPLLADMVAFCRAQGVPGVGQSSWGPTLYAVTDGDDAAERLAGAVQRRYELGQRQVLITEPDNVGASVRRVAASSESRNPT